MNWVEFFEERPSERIVFLSLVAEGSDADVSRAFKGSDGYLLSKPIEESDANGCSRRSAEPCKNR